MKRLVRVLGIVGIIFWLAAPAFAIVVPPDYVTLVYKGKNTLGGIDNDNDLGLPMTVSGKDNIYVIFQVDMNANAVTDVRIVSWWKQDGGLQGDSEQLFNFVPVVDDTSLRPQVVLASFNPFDSLTSIGSVHLQGKLVSTDIGGGRLEYVPRLLKGAGILSITDIGYEGTLMNMLSLSMKLDDTRYANVQAETVDATVLRLMNFLSASKGVVFN